MRRALLCLLLVGCAPEIPDGTYVCDSSADCPPGMSCQGGLCYRAPDAGPCVPQDCAALRANCGTLDDGCGDEIDCGACRDGEACGTGGIPNLCGCQPQSCDALGVECGVVDSGCGDSIDCGSCNGVDACVSGICECEPQNPCNPSGYDCGLVPDGCGGMISCGTCAGPATCGGGGETNRCGVGACVPDRDECAGRECGVAPDGCGDLISCGACTAPDTCVDATGTCTCAAQTCASLGFECGAADDGCGTPLDCGGCPAGQGCTASTHTCECVPDPHEANNTYLARRSVGALSSAATARLGDGTMHTPSDVDWYSWSVPTTMALGTHRFAVQLGDIPFGANYALEAFVICGGGTDITNAQECITGSPTTVGPPPGGGCLSDRAGRQDEQVVIAQSCTAMELVVRVRQVASGLCAPYSLSVEYGFTPKT